MTSRLSDLFDSSYIVYKLINHDRKEIYYGITNDFQKRLKAHQNNDVKATLDWVFKSQDIDQTIIDRNLIKTKASDKAHNLSNGSLTDALRYSDYDVIDTGGW